MQKKVLAAVREVLAVHGLQSVETWSFSNTGTIYVQPIGSIATLFRIPVSFQSGYMSAAVLLTAQETEVMGCVNVGGRDIDPDRKRSFPYLEYHNDVRMRALLAAVESACTSWDGRLPTVTRPPAFKLVEQIARMSPDEEDASGTLNRLIETARGLVQP
jgi:hypothetical protein